MTDLIINYLYHKRKFPEKVFSKYKLTALSLQHWHLVQELKAAFSEKRIKSIAKSDSCDQILHHSIKHVHFGADLFAHMSLCLNFFDMTSLDARCFAEFKSLTDLKLANTCLEKVEADSFMGLENLTQLHILECPHLKIIEANAFKSICVKEGIFFHLSSLTLLLFSNLFMPHLVRNLFKGL